MRDAERVGCAVTGDNARPGTAGTVLRAVNLSKSYPPVEGSGPGLQLFRDLHLEVGAGEMVAIVGRSGAGKSSLLHLLAGLERPSAGELSVAGKSVNGLSRQNAAEMRNRMLGFVWQFHYLLPEFSAAENVAMPLLARGVPSKQAMADALQMLVRVELGNRAQHRSGELSGGEQQRVAIARALVTRPMVLLADEPTGDLDERTASLLFALMQKLCREDGLGAVIVTHNMEIAGRCDRMLRLAEGRLEPAEREIGLHQGA